MVYRKRPPKSRKYKKFDSHAKNNEFHSNNIEAISDKNTNIEEESVALSERSSCKGKKGSQPFGFLTSLFGSNDKCEKTGKPIINLLNHDIYLDDLLLIGLILLLLTDKIEDEILIIILVYLLLDFI